MFRSTMALVAALAVTGLCITEVIAHGNPNLVGRAAVASGGQAEPMPVVYGKAITPPLVNSSYRSSDGTGEGMPQAVMVRYEQHRPYYDAHRHGAYALRNRQ